MTEVRTEPSAAEAQDGWDAAGEESLLALLAALSPDSSVDTLREAIHEAVRGLGPDDIRAGWPLLRASAGRLGIHLSVRRQPFGQARREVLGEAPVVARVGSSWAIVQGSGRKVRVLYPTRTKEEPEVERRSLRALREGLGVSSNEGEWTFGVAREAFAIKGLSPHPEATPWQRLVGVMTPERQDLKLVLVFSVAVGLLGLATPVAVEALVNTVAFGGLLQPILVLALVLLGCLGLQACLYALEVYVVELIQQRLFVRVASDLAYRLPRWDVRGLETTHGPEKVNRFFDVLNLQKAGSKLLLDGLNVALTGLVGLVVLAFYHPLLLAFDLVLLLSLAVIVFVLGHGGVRTGLVESGQKYAMVDWLQELARRPLTFRPGAASQRALDGADGIASAWLDARRLHFRVVLRQLLAALALQVVASTLLLGLGGWLVEAGQLTLGQLVASWLIVSMVVSAVTKLGGHLEGCYDVLVGAAKLGTLTDMSLERADGEVPPPREGPAALRVRQLWASAPGVAPILRGFEAEFEAGARVAISGPSGSGKGFLAEILYGLRDASAGGVELDGLDIRHLRLEELRRQVMLVRATEAIGGSVADNVRALRPERTVAEVRAALEAVGLWDRVQRLGRGLDAELNTGGRPFSDGEVRLLMIARAICTRPRVLLVDGVLDGLTPEEASRARRALQDPAAPWTLLVFTREVPGEDDGYDQVIRLEAK